MTALNKQALRKLAKALSGKEWVAFVHKASGTYAVGSLGHERGEDIIKWPGFDGQDNAESKAKFIAAANPATVLALLDELEAAENELNTCKSILEKIKSTSCHVDTSPGAFIPNSLDAWGRPVPQYLSYDFSGNPGASATQYCNGWNDAGGYWLNHVKYLQECIRAAGIGVKG